MNEYPVQYDDGRVACHECGTVYERVGYHWSNGSCQYPSIPERSQSIIDGLMLGDGTLRRSNSTPFVQTYMINEAFLEWIDTQLGWLTTGVSLYRTADRAAELSRHNGHPTADSEDYHDVYVLQTRSLPQFRRYNDWYGEESKGLPAYLSLSPETASIWYACDGSLNWDRRFPGARPYASIGVTSVVDDADRVIDWFASTRLDANPSVGVDSIRFSVDDTETFLDWLDPVPDGFEYKWYRESLSGYESLKESCLS